MDYTTLTDEQLVEAWRAVNAELERRQRVAATPAKVATMTTEYVAAGGARADLATAVADAPDPDPTVASTVADTP